MNWKREIVEKLRDYPSKLEALEQIPIRLKTLDMAYTGLRAAKTDGTPVSGGTNLREDMLLNNIMEREELRLNYSITKRQADLLEKGLNLLPEEERKVLDRFYIHCAKGNVDRLCDELNYEKSKIYMIKDQALRRLTMNMYGVIEL